MILIDKRKTNQRLIVTLTENSDNIDANYRLDVHSPFSNKSYSVNLPENTSSFKERFDEFILSTSLINDWETGFYNYSITEINAGMVEVGSLKVIDADTVPVPFISIQKTETDDDFIIYQS